MGETPSAGGPQGPWAAPGPGVPGPGTPASGDWAGHRPRLAAPEGVAVPPQHPRGVPEDEPVAEPGALWMDDRPLLSEWDPPRWYDRFTLGQKLLALVVALALVVGGLWAGGALKPRATVDVVDWQTPVVSGPVEVTVLGATFDEDDERIDVRALCRLVVDSATRVQSDDVRRGVSLRTTEHPIRYEQRSVRFTWSSPDSLAREELAPGVQPTPCMISGKVPEGYKPEPSVALFAFRQYYSDRNEAQSGGPGWRVQRGGVMMVIPLVVVAKKQR